jgi:hypothetical protein
MQPTPAAPSFFYAPSRYILAIALVSAALLLSLVLRVPFGNPFFPIAVVASTWFGGKGPGWVAVCASTLTSLSRTPDQVVGQRRDTAAKTSKTFDTHRFYLVPAIHSWKQHSSKQKEASSAWLKPALSALQFL